MFLVGNIAGSLIAVIAFIAFINGLLGWFGALVGIEELSIELIFGYIFLRGLAAELSITFHDTVSLRTSTPILEKYNDRKI